ncbi:MAG TPA: hypothetical protein VGJ70_16280 [Solirubrobacteraceae bacterium]|jgi:hypothetical protein
MSALALPAYRGLIDLDAPFRAPAPLTPAARPRGLRGLVDHLVHDGTAERLDADLSGLGHDAARLRPALRALLTIR